MDLVKRAKNICLTPATEWNVIAGEATPPAQLITGYVLPLAAVGAVAGFVGGSIIGGLIMGRTPIVFGLAIACLAVLLAVISVFVVSFLIDAFAPTFGAQKNSTQAFKIAAYAYTPAWIAGVFQILPIVGGLFVFIGSLYGIYLLYLGLPRLMRCPEDKAAGYTIVVIICTIVISLTLTMVSGVIVGGALVTRGALGGLVGGGAASDPDSPLGRLEQLGQSLDEASKKMDAAERSGDSAGQAAAAMEGLSALLGGGRRVDPVEIDQLKVFVPETFLGLPRTENSAEKTGLGTVMVSRADATYSEGPRYARLEIVDSGGASGLMGLASWVGVQGERETSDTIERTRRVGDRLVHEQRSKIEGGTHEYGVLLADRFMVTVRGRGVEFSELEAAVSRLGLDRLEGLRDAGVQR
jgi:hypothetical protein